MTPNPERCVRGDRLRIERQQRQLTQTELATVAGVSRQLISAIENGHHSPGVDAAIALARVFDVPVDALFGAPRSPADEAMDSVPKPAHRERLRVERERLGLTQTELAQVAGVSRQLISTTEAGHSKPGVDAAIALARVIGVPVEELFGSRSDIVLTSG
jgi:putative transcriptional regulator